MNANGRRCFLHDATGKPAKPCGCEYHCTGCRHAYGPRREDCCTCCHGYDERPRAKR